MKNRLLLSITLLSMMAFGFACGGAANNVNNSNAARNVSNINTMPSTPAPVPSMSVSTPSNTMGNKLMPANSAANKTANTAAAKPPKGSTFECNDGTYSDAKTSQGACSGHGGIKAELKKK